MVEEEHVLVIPAIAAEEYVDLRSGFAYQEEATIIELLQDRRLTFMPRSLAEVDPSFKQIIPYVIFISPARMHQVWGNRVFVYTRGNGGGEARLHKKKSIGIGGHINLSDHLTKSTEDAYIAAVKRELLEEVSFDTDVRHLPRTAGIVYDGSSLVSQVHLGIVHTFYVEEQSLVVSEDDIEFSGFKRGFELLQEPSFEDWSQHCISRLLSSGIISQ